MEISFDERGLVPVITQDAESGQVLMLAWSDREAIDATLATGAAHYHSRSRGELWRKGATSGNTQEVVAVRLDCDADAVLYLVKQSGPACHTGERTCFHVDLSQGDESFGHPAQRAVRLLDDVVADRLAKLPEGSYVAGLHERGLGYIAQKVVEEAGESIVAALQGDDEGLKGEAADVLFHLSVMLHERGLTLDDVAEVLLERHH